MPARSLNQAVDGANRPRKPRRSLRGGAAADRERPSPRQIRIFVVEDHAAVRKGLKTLLELQPDLQLCGEAAGVATAKPGIAGLHPDLVLVDLRLANGDGFELMNWLRRQHPHIKMLVHTSHGDVALAERSARCGALGYIAKHDSAQELIGAIRMVMQNQAYISSSVARHHRLFRRSGAKP